MEMIFGIVVIAIGWFLFNMLVSAGTRTAGAAVKAAVGKGTFSENMDLAFKGMAPMEARFSNARFGENGDGPSYKAIEVKGLFSVTGTRQVAFVTSVFDATDGKWAPVLGAIEMFQEPETIAYQHLSEIGKVSSDQGFISWTRVGAVVPELLQPPYSGARKFIAVLRLVDLDKPSSILLGQRDKTDRSILWETSLEFVHTVTDKGYTEATEHRDQARALSIKIGMAVAMADGSLDDSEGEVLKGWIFRAISPFSDEKRERVKNLYNQAMSDAFELAKTGELSLSRLTGELNEIAEKSARYETIELCFDIMAADGVADAEEMRVIRVVAEALDLDFDEIEQMRDRKILGLDVSVASQGSVSELLGIEKDWDADQTKKHLRVEFQKWNNRLNTLSEGEERDNAQRMLDLIAEARKSIG